MTKKELNIYAQCAESMLTKNQPLDRQTLKGIVKGHMQYLQSMSKLVEGLSVSIPDSASKKKNIQLWADSQLVQYVYDNFYIQDYLAARDYDEDGE
jgi:hypothetical protein